MAETLPTLYVLAQDVHQARNYQREHPEYCCIPVTAGQQHRLYGLRGATYIVLPGWHKFWGYVEMEEVLGVINRDVAYFGGKRLKYMEPSYA